MAMANDLTVVLSSKERDFLISTNGEQVYVYYGTIPSIVSKLTFSKLL